MFGIFGARSIAYDTTSPARSSGPGSSFRPSRQRCSKIHTRPPRRRCLEALTGPLRPNSEARRIQRALPSRPLAVDLHTRPHSATQIHVTLISTHCVCILRRRHVQPPSGRLNPNACRCNHSSVQQVRAYKDICQMRL